LVHHTGRRHGAPAGLKQVCQSPDILVGMSRHVAAYVEQDRVKAKHRRGIQIPRPIVDKDNILRSRGESLHNHSVNRC
jgi:hypothetical protein